MSDLINILDSWDTAEQAEIDKDYALAARMYRLCNVYYENGELNMYCADAADKGQLAYKNFWKMLKKLPKEQQTEIKREYAIHFGSSPTSQLFLSDWQAFVREQYHIIHNSFSDSK